MAKDKRGGPSSPSVSSGVNSKRQNTLRRKSKKVLQSSGYKYFMEWADKEFRAACPSAYRELIARAEQQGKTSESV